MQGDAFFIVMFKSAARINVLFLHILLKNVK